MEISVDAARELTLWKQGFHVGSNREKADVLETIRKLGCVQIDTINVVERSHYLVLWSRLGPYSKEYLDQLLYPDRKLFEFWAHAASIIPMEDYRYFIHAMKEYRKELKTRAERWLKDKTHLLDQVLAEIRKNGPMSSKDFKQEAMPKKKGVGWWDWKPAKIALEMLFNAGILMVAYRRNFQRYYDLTENVLPPHVDTTEPTEEERRRFFVEKAFEAYGVGKTEDMGSCYYQWSTRTSTKPKDLEQTVRDLLNQDILAGITVKGLPGQYYMPTSDSEIAQKIAERGIPSFSKVTFLSPFDNLTWSKGRTRTIFQFTPKLEAYVQKDKRKFGYYAMNVLYRKRLIGRLDPKLHRERSMLEIRSFQLDEHFKPDAEFEVKLAQAFRSLMEFTKAKEMTFGKAVPDKMRISGFGC